MYFNVNFNVFLKLIKVHLLLSELYIPYGNLYFDVLKMLINEKFFVKLQGTSLF